MNRIATALALALALAPAAAPRADAQATTAFYGLQNNASTTLAAAYTPGSGQLVLQPGAGAMFGSPTTSSPIRVTCVQQSTKSLAIFKATGRSGDTLTGVSVFPVPALDATADIPFAAGDAVQMRVTAGTLADIHAAVNAAEGKLVLSAKGDIPAFGTSYARLPVGPDGQVLTADSSQALGVRWATPAGTGTVTSVAATVPSVLTVSGSPVTSAGTLAFGLASQSGNSVFAAPADGTSGVPSFRSLVAADVPTLDGAKIGTGTVAAARLPLMGGSGASHAAGIAPDPGSVAGTTKYLREDGTWQVPSGTGTGLTSVGLTMPSAFTVTGSPLTSNGSIGVSYAAQSPNLVLAGPSSGAAAAPTFRALAAADIPSLSSVYQPLDADLTAISALSPTKGNVLAGNGSAWVALGVGANGQVLTADSTQAAGVKWAAGGGGGGGSSLLYTATAAATIDNTATETTTFGAGSGSLTLAAGTLTAGKTIAITQAGYLSTPGTGQGQARVRVYLGSTLLWDSGSQTAPVQAVNWAFRDGFTIVCRSAGATGSVACAGDVTWQSNSSGAARIIGPTTPGPATVDTTVDQVLNVTWTWSSAVVGDTAVIQTGTVEAKN